jgi:hypothetical protein
MGGAGLVVGLRDAWWYLEWHTTEYERIWATKSEMQIQWRLYRRRREAYVKKTKQLVITTYQPAIFISIEYLEHILPLPSSNPSSPSIYSS